MFYTYQHLDTSRSFRCQTKHQQHFFQLQLDLLIWLAFLGYVTPFSVAITVSNHFPVNLSHWFNGLSTVFLCWRIWVFDYMTVDMLLFHEPLWCHCWSLGMCQWVCVAIINVKNQSFTNISGAVQNRTCIILSWFNTNKRQHAEKDGRTACWKTTQQSCLFRSPFPPSHYTGCSLHLP